MMWSQVRLEHRKDYNRMVDTHNAVYVLVHEGRYLAAIAYMEKFSDKYVSPRLTRILNEALACRTD